MIPTNPSPEAGDRSRRILAIIRDHVEAIGAADTARLLGLDRSTISRRLAGGRLQAWSVADLAALCADRPGDLGSQTWHAIGRVLLPGERGFADRFELEALRAVAHLARFVERLCEGMAERDRASADLEGIRSDLVGLARRFRDLLDEVDRLRPTV